MSKDQNRDSSRTGMATQKPGQQRQQEQGGQKPGQSQQNGAPDRGGPARQQQQGEQHRK